MLFSQHISVPQASGKQVAPGRTLEYPLYQVGQFNDHGHCVTDVSQQHLTSALSTPQGQANDLDQAICMNVPYFGHRLSHMWKGAQSRLVQASKTAGPSCWQEAGIR